jgi:hypothetical protein
VDPRLPRASSRLRDGSELMESGGGGGGGGEDWVAEVRIISREGASRRVKGSSEPTGECLQVGALAVTARFKE